MNRVAIFSHYSPRNTIEDYVVYFLQELKKIAEDIIFVSDCETLVEAELNKTKPYIKNSIVGKHNEYDFGSYKRGYYYLKDQQLLHNYEELIFVNDSCYAPLFPFKEMFSKMDELDNLDFWGNTCNKSILFNNIPHIQSYFIVFKKNVFLNSYFDSFINSIKHEKNKRKIIAKYEVGLTKLLQNNGYKWDVYCNISKYYTEVHLLYSKESIKFDRNPFLKRSLVLNRDDFILLKLEDFITKNTPYKYILIGNDIDNNKIPNTIFKIFNKIRILLTYIPRKKLIDYICSKLKILKPIHK